MNIILIGRTKALIKTADLLVKEGHKIVGIVTAKAAPEYDVNESHFASLSKKLGAKYISLAKISSAEGLDFLKSCGTFDIGISLNYVNIITQDIIDLFPLGILNAHGGDLPRYRGNACQAWAIISGENSIGLCVHKMIGGELDSGDIIARDYFSIDINTRIGQVLDWFDENIPALFQKAIKELTKNNQYVLETQSKDLVNILRCYPRCPEDGAIVWSSSSEEILRLVNASSEPYMGAFCYYGNEKLIIYRAVLYNDEERYLAIPGQISKIIPDKGVVVITGQGKLLLLDVEYMGIRCKPSEIIKSVRSRLISC